MVDLLQRLRAAINALQQSVRSFALRFAPGPSVHLLRTGVPEKDRSIQFANDNRIMRQIQKTGLSRQKPRCLAAVIDLILQFPIRDAEAASGVGSLDERRENRHRGGRSSESMPRL